MKVRSFIFVLCGLIAIFGTLWVGYQFYWKPKILLRAAEQLPSVPQSLKITDVEISADGSFCADLPPTRDLGSLQNQIQQIRRDLIERPNDLCVGNRFRQAVRYQAIVQSQFAISVESLPNALVSLVREDGVPMNQLPLTEDGSSRSSEAEPVALFKELDGKEDSPELSLQLGLSYVDLMIHEGGREEKARLSSRSIEALTHALERNPYLLGALYGRGVNYLYWPVIAGKLPYAVADLKNCIALSNLPVMKSRPPVIIAESYLALGDAYVKLSDTDFSGSDKRAFMAAARFWWREGANRFSGYPAFDQRLVLTDGELLPYVEKMRGLETYINTDLNLLWRR